MFHLHSGGNERRGSNDFSLSLNSKHAPSRRWKQPHSVAASSTGSVTPISLQCLREYF